MKSLYAALGFAALIAGFSSDVRAEGESATMTLADALASAHKDSPELAISAAAIAGAERELKAAKALRLPSVKVEASVLRWNEPIEIDFSIPGLEPPPGMELDPIVVRDQLTTQTTVTVVEPLSTQIPIASLIGVSRHGLDAAGFEHDQTQADVVVRAAQAYLGLLLAQAARDVISASVEQVEAQLERARVLKEAGVLETVDLMRLESALADTKRRHIDAETRVELGRDQLMLTLGRPLSTRFSVIDDLPEQPRLLSIDEDQAVELAVTGRPELKAARSRVRQAHSAAMAVKSHLYPNIVAVASYQNNQGSGSFSAENTFFVGLTLSWEAWDWGHNWHAYKAAGVKAKRAELSTVRFEDHLMLQARASARDARAAHAGLSLARTGLQAADEAYRINSIRFDEGALTTTDLLDAQTDVTRARFGYANARFSYFLKVIALAQATGQAPQDLLSKL